MHRDHARQAIPAGAGVRDPNREHRKFKVGLRCQTLNKVVGTRCKLVVISASDDDVADIAVVGGTR
jgi:hypothetical protein